MDLRALEKEFEKDGEIVVSTLQEWAEKIGDKNCFYYGEEDQRLTFKRFNELTNSIGHQLKAMGVGQGDRIALFLKNALVTTLAMFGIWKVGAIFSPINFNYKGRLLSYQIKDTAPKLLITEQNMIPLLKDIQSEIPELQVILHRPKEGEHDYIQTFADGKLGKKAEEIPFEALLKGETKNLGTEIHYSDTANILYTSGTTGAGKGVVQSHRWMNAYTINARRICNQEDVFYIDLPLYHVGGAIHNVTRAVWIGCEIAVWDKFSPHDFWRRIELSGASHTTLLDVMIPWLMKAPATPKDRLNPLNKVHMQPLPQYHHQVAERFGIDFITGGYGQTESGNGFLGIIDELGGVGGTPKKIYKGYSREELRRIARKYGYPFRSAKKEIKKGFMGKPSFFMEATILNEKDEELGPGQYGQLAYRNKIPYIMLKEYFNKPQVTVEVFRNLWFHTGDACYKDESGVFYFVDRLGGFIRTRGENISSYQVEDIMNSHPKVEVCAVFPIPAEEGEEDDIVAYVVLKPGEILEEEELRKWLAAEMPKFMWPKYIRFVEDLPRTPTNKIEKYKLKDILLIELGKKKEA